MGAPRPHCCADLSAVVSIPAERTASTLLAGQSKRGRLIKRTGDIGFSLVVRDGVIEAIEGQL